MQQGAVGVHAVSGGKPWEWGRSCPRGPKEAEAAHKCEGRRGKARRQRTMAGGAFQPLGTVFTEASSQKSPRGHGLRSRPKLLEDRAGGGGGES